MTNEQAIEILRDTPIDIRSTIEDDIHTLYAMAQNMAIEALKHTEDEEQFWSEQYQDIDDYPDTVGDAIRYLDGLRSEITNTGSYEYENITMVIEALRGKDINVRSKDTIYRQDAIDAIEEVDWYHQNRNKDMVSGANSYEHQAWYKVEDVYKALESVPSAQQACSMTVDGKMDAKH